METTEYRAAPAGHSVDAQEWVAEFDTGFAAIAGRFGRVELRRQARAFLLGLLSDVDTRSCWQLAEQAVDAVLREARWKAGGFDRRDPGRPGWTAALRVALTESVRVVQSWGEEAVTAPDLLAGILSYPGNGAFRTLARLDLSRAELPSYCQQGESRPGMSPASLPCCRVRTC